MKSITLSSLAMLIACILSACGQAAPPPPLTPTLPSPTSVPTSTPVLTLPELAGRVCQGQGFPQAAAFDPESGAAHKIFIAGSTGERHEWNDSLPAALQAQNDAELEAVLCLEGQKPVPEEFGSCGDYTNSFGQPVTLKVGQYHLAAKLIAAHTGEVIELVDATGGKPPICPGTVASDDPHWIDGAFYGEPVNFGSLLAEAAPSLTPGMISQVIEAKAGYVYLVAVSNDGTRLATYNGLYDNEGPAIHVWETATDKQLASLDGNPTALAFSPDNRLLASSEASGKIVLWDLTTGQPAVLAEGDSANRDWIQLAFAPDGKTLASSGSDAALRIWNTDSGKLMKKLKTDGGGGKLIFSNDGKRLIVYNRETLELWDMTINRPIGRIYDANQSLNWAGFSSDGKQLLALAYEINRYRLQELDATTGERLESKPWVEFGQQMTNYLDPLVLPDVQWLVLTDQGSNLILWDMQQNNELTWLRKGPEARYADESVLGASANGQFFAIGDADGYVNLWDFSWASLP